MDPRGAPARGARTGSRSTRRTVTASSPCWRLSDTMVEQLYVAPRLDRAWGRPRAARARQGQRPDGLDLYCFAVNAAARRFYERNGFVPSHSATAPGTWSASRTCCTDGTRPERHAIARRPVGRRDTDRGVQRRAGSRSGRDGSAARPRPRRGSGPHDVPGHRPAPGRAIRGPRHRSARARRLRRHRALRDRARVRGRRGCRRGDRDRHGGAGSRSSAIPTAGDARSGRRC